MAKPFLKWAGGKSQLLDDINKKIPKSFGKSMNKYCEPFIGGGAVLFDILENYSLSEILINDINSELINTYLQIKNNLDNMITELADLQTKYWSLDDNKRRDYYNKTREIFNATQVNNSDRNNIIKAKLFIFLNKTCFNGLYRVNKKGLYNVPIGSYKKPLICDSENLAEVSKLLKNVEIKCGDYSECTNFADKNTLFYIDPPYRPITATSSFTSYDKSVFDDYQQIKLGCFVDKICNLGASVLLSNSDPKNTNINDEFFDNLYKNYKIDRISAKRMINSNSAKRGNVSELLITNF